ncbi:unnamed protein product [Urochloa humidicola]
MHSNSVSFYALILILVYVFLQFLVDILTKECIVRKLKMLTSSSFVKSRLHAVKAQTQMLDARVLKTLHLHLVLLQKLQKR